MRNYFILWVVFLTFSSCKKSVENVPLKGVWKFNNAIDNVWKSQFLYVLTDYKDELGIELEITDKFLIFSSSKGVKKFKINNWAPISVQSVLDTTETSTKSVPTYEIYNLVKHPPKPTIIQWYRFELDGVKGQMFYFDYGFDPTKPELLYGDYWIKGQNFADGYIPNISHQNSQILYYDKDQIRQEAGLVERLVQFKKS